ncbi:hypothetical protein ACFPPA_11840 [Rhodanobacter ginsengisoli]|uniref:Uncharacterized protein n=1 Tax=Rhodanobacter ginsengisoli TaxID=418646 RepID=A0ABW0QN90_9GAMM
MQVLLRQRGVSLIEVLGSTAFRGRRWSSHLLQPANQGAVE